MTEPAGHMSQCPICDEKHIEIQEWRNERLRTLNKEHYEKLADLANAHARGEHD